MIRQFILVFVAGLPLCVSAIASQTEFKLSGPSGHVSATISIDENRQMQYTLKRDRLTVIEKSELGIIIDDVDLGLGVDFGKATFRDINEKYPWYGVKSEASDHCRAMELSVKHLASGQNWVFEARAYDDGFAYRYVIPGTGQRAITGEKTNWRLPAGSQIWFQTNTKNYEGVHVKRRPEDVNSYTNLGPPVTIELPDKSYAAITEAALFNYSGMTMCGTGTNAIVAIFEDDPNGFSIDGTITSPWRVVMTGPDLNALVNCDIVHNVCEPPDTKLFPQGLKTEWIKPGRALWHWWSGDSNSVKFENQKWWIDNAARMGFEYVLVDAGWETVWKTDTKDKWQFLAELVEYARSKNVRVWVWKYWTTRTRGGETGGLETHEKRVDFFKRCKDAGVVGVKIDFMDSESKDRIDFYAGVLRDAAEAKLMINFHGANKPTGEDRTWPNEMTREGIRGLEYNKWDALPPDHYASLPFTRFLAGHGDFTPCTFNPRSLKGTTVTFQLATAVIYTSPVINWADNPNFYLESPALELIKRIPSVWDQTIVLPGCKIGELAGFARRKGNDWFIGVINGSNNKQEFGFDLSFLGKSNYKAMIARDKTGERTAMAVENAVVWEKQKIVVDLEAGGGFAAWLTPANH
jgi:alpha-glucosidase